MEFEITGLIMIMLLPVWVPAIIAIIFYTISKIIKKSQIETVEKSYYYRDIPCFKKINVAYWLLYNFSNYKQARLNNGLIGAYLLKWYQKGYIDIISTKEKTKKDNGYSIDLKNGEWEKDSIEEKLYSFLEQVAGKNNILEKDEFKKYCISYSNKLNELFKGILEETKKELVSNVEIV